MALPWFRVDTNFFMHDKMLNLLQSGQKGKAAAFVYIASLAYSAGNATDGFIASYVLPKIEASKNDAVLLASVRLWDVVEGGYQIRNWGERQLTAAAAEAIAQSKSEAGKRAANARWGNNA